MQTQTKETNDVSKEGLEIWQDYFRIDDEKETIGGGGGSKPNNPIQTLRIHIDTELESAMQELDKPQAELPKEQCASLFEQCANNALNAVEKCSLLKTSDSNSVKEVVLTGIETAGKAALHSAVGGMLYDLIKGMMIDKNPYKRVWQ